MYPTDVPPETADSPDLPPSKTRRKQEMHALQELGEALVALDPKRLALLDLPERLFDAIGQARGIRAHEGRRRQLQYVGKLMRGVDSQPIRAKLDQWASGAAGDREQFAATERWRDELLADPDALDRYLTACPTANRTRLAALISRARAERTGQSPPHAFRELFRILRADAEAQE